MNAFRIPNNRLSIRKRKEPNAISLVELTKLVKQIHRPDLMMAVFISWIFGLRREEVINLKCSDILLEQKQIKVVDGKFGKDRYIPIIDDRYIPILQKWLKMHKNNEYFISSFESKEPQISKTALYVSFEHALDKAGLNIIEYEQNNGRKRRKYNFHSLRHGFASYLLKRGFNIEHIRRLMGHADLRTTTVYLHITNNDILKTADELVNKNKVIEKSPNVQLPTQFMVDPIQQLKSKFVNNEITEQEYLRKIALLGKTEKIDSSYFG